MSRAAKYLGTVVVVLVIVALFISFTRPGHQVMYMLGVMSACDGDCS